MTADENWDAPPRPTDECTYEMMMRSLDRHLAALDLHIFQRPSHAARKLAMAYGTAAWIQMVPAPRMEDHLRFSAEYLVARAHHWYADQYGDAVKTRPELGFYLVQLDHRAWKVRAPFFYGTAEIYLDRHLKLHHPNIVSRAPVPINMLDCFDGMTQTYANALTDDELELIFTRFTTAFSALTLLDVLDRGPPLYRQARVDYNHSVEALCSVDRSYGRARRDIATCAEKLMKGILSGRSVKYELNHDLVKLAKLVNVGGAPYADVDLARKISTPASVSYDKPVSKQEALEAHTNLLCFLAAMQAPPHES